MLFGTQDTLEYSNRNKICRFGGASEQQETTSAANYRLFHHEHNLKHYKPIIISYTNTMEDYKNEEEHLKHADSPAGIDEIKADIDSHFVSGGVEDDSDMNIVMHSTDPDAAPRDLPADSQLAKELDEMAARHEADGDEKFVRGVAGLEYAYADEEADAE
jgi:hypothetical protein